MKKGFTLVELSIVLVIIGLLIGGILASRSMISAAKVQRYVTSLHQYEIAVSNFKTSYKNEPGDSPMFDAPGNGNGYNNDNCCSWMDGICVGPYDRYEMWSVWGHLSQANMVSGNLSSYKPGYCPGGTMSSNNMDMANGDIKGAPVFAIVPGLKIAGYATANSPLFYEVESDGARRFVSHLTPHDLLALDSKMDNGNVTTGNFYSWVCNTSTDVKDDTIVCPFRWVP